MSGRHKHADSNWTTETNGVVSDSDARLAVLMDIRHELKLLNSNLRKNIAYTRSVRDEIRQVNKHLLNKGYRLRK